MNTKSGQCLFSLQDKYTKEIFDPIQGFQIAKSKTTNISEKDLYAEMPKLLQ